MYSTREDLESAYGNGPLLQRRRHFHGHWHLQRRFRLCNSDSTYALCLEVAYAAEKKDTNDDHLCDGFLVSMIHEKRYLPDYQACRVVQIGSLLLYLELNPVTFD